MLSSAECWTCKVGAKGERHRPARAPLSVCEAVLRTQVPQRARATHTCGENSTGACIASQASPRSARRRSDQDGGCTQAPALARREGSRARERPAEDGVPEGEEKRRSKATAATKRRRERAAMHGSGSWGNGRTSAVVRRPRGAITLNCRSTSPGDARRMARASDKPSCAVRPRASEERERLFNPMAETCADREISHRSSMLPILVCLRGAQQTERRQPSLQLCREDRDSGCDRPGLLQREGETPGGQTLEMWRANVLRPKAAASWMRLQATRSGTYCAAAGASRPAGATALPDTESAEGHNRPPRWSTEIRTPTCRSNPTHQLHRPDRRAAHEMDEAMLAQVTAKRTDNACLARRLTESCTRGVQTKLCRTAAGRPAERPFARCADRPCARSPNHARPSDRHERPQACSTECVPGGLDLPQIVRRVEPP